MPAGRALLVSHAMRQGFKREAAVAVLNAMLDEMERALCDGDRVELRGHFSLFPVTRKARPARNPRTGEVVPLPERVTARVTFNRGYLG